MLETLLYGRPPMPPFTLHEILMICVLLCVAYLIGTIPSGLWIGKLAGLGDIRKKGSGNIGATNVYRHGGKFLAAATLCADMLKTQLPILLAAFLFMDSARPVDPIYMAACFAFLGHVFPIWLKGKGGKGIACYVAILVTFHPMIAAFFALTWIPIFWVTRLVSLASLSGVVVTTIASFYVPHTDHNFLLLLLTLATVTFIAHRENIKRLVQRTELAIR